MVFIYSLGPLKNIRSCFLKNICGSRNLFHLVVDIIPIKCYGLDPYFRSAAALSDAPPPLPVDLVACEGLAGGS